MIQHGRKVTMKWRNGSSITGYVHATEEGGANLVFGPKGEWGINYFLPGDGNGTPPKMVEAFQDTDVQWHEPPGFGAVIRAHEKGDDVLELWVRMSGVWHKDQYTARVWDDFDQSTVEVLTDGFVE